MSLTPREGAVGDDGGIRSHFAVKRSHASVALRCGLRQCFGHGYANLRCAALRTERLAVFDTVSAFVAGMIHGIKEGLA